MPIYEYLCLDCGTPCEQLVLGLDEDVSCPSCKSTRLRKLLSASSPASGPKGEGRLPSQTDTACCGSRPGASGCIPGSCCGK
ncbi:MAG TPA: zinc ribbon domain-containing protein [Syntrophobacteraceae bacterium]|nr:zinc ribbon domain-containing protein [Syntrophobacteraceae bacterium]